MYTPATERGFYGVGRWSKYSTSFPPDSGTTTDL